MYKLCIYKTLHFDNDDLDHEEFFKNEQEVYKRYRELLYDGINYLTVWKLVGDQKYSMLECCANCKNFAFLLKNNKYQDIELFCFATGYFISKFLNTDYLLYHSALHHQYPTQMKLVLNNYFFATRTIF